MMSVTCKTTLLTFGGVELSFRTAQCFVYYALFCWYKNVNFPSILHTL